jgi:hypothetical protein
MALLLWRHADLFQPGFSSLFGWHALARCGSGAIAAAWFELIDWS